MSRRLQRVAVRLSFIRSGSGGTSEGTLVRAVALCLSAIFLVFGVGTVAAAAGQPPERPWERIDLVIALDTSGSMGPLIESARLVLWDIANDLSLLEPEPQVRLALLTYGTCNADYKTGWVQVETGFTEDLDLVSERLFAPTCDGGGEYVGRALRTALEGLSWTSSHDALKLIFIAGNEPADQDPDVSFRDMADLALREGVFVQAIFCGPEGHEDAASWKELAELAEGQFASIDLQAGTVAVETPFDARLAELSTAINETFVPLSEQGQDRLERLFQQDEELRKASPAAAARRAEVKARLDSSGWDLVGALAARELNVAELGAGELSESLRGMSPDERSDYVEEMRVRREDLRHRIADLAQKRRQYLSQQSADDGPIDFRSFAEVVRRTIRERAAEKGFEAPEP